MFTTVCIWLEAIADTLKFSTILTWLLTIYVVISRFLLKIMEYYSGTLRIKNPKTLQKWIDKGWYKEQIDAGWIFAPNCGRFRTEKCECAKCRKVNGGQALKEVLTRNGL